ncbi:hypothetical protein QFZ77_003974 [Paenibacillus sp. V4I3]|uniref:hypothetical protein n=1 Tax=unclassified Paenibacillus TaxID=185978 RepID=UPI0027827F57|nr:MULTISPECIES: hypothetical protein [unclassified Paenibacillus]MDQ0875315.1 hypothetical protein [Paenibacillus sp. V4I3]MDQ0888954.1 hypothetical protein [Paenibacillus sp. V4I9]
MLNQAFDGGEVVQKDGEIWVRGGALQDIFVGEYLYLDNNDSLTSKYFIKQIKTYGKYIDGLYAPMTGDLLVEVEGELKTGEHIE